MALRRGFDSAGVDAYRREWFAARAAATRSSAKAIVPYIVEIVQPRSIVDVGCGPGSWLAVAAEIGVSRVVGIDGDWIDRDQLEISVDCFVPRDLLRDRIRLNETFDLAFSLEVAEHLPIERASAFVHELVTLAPVVLFSAAVPFQGGTAHRNEQWPEYWERLFGEHDYVGVDCVRPRYWNDERVRYFYAQNAVLYVDKGRLKEFPGLGAAVPLGEPVNSLVHPRLYLNALRRFPAPDDVDVRGLGRFLVSLAASWVRRDRRV
jgi:SAM-dependent methyltransferase